MKCALISRHIFFTVAVTMATTVFCMKCFSPSELPKVFIKGDTSVTVMAGTEYSMRCIGQGIPLPSLHWVKVGGVLSSNIIVSNGALHFQSVTSAASGRYRCFGENPYGRVFAEIQMNVEGECLVCDCCFNK